jgi:ATP-dependent Clp protease adaptor protein ClpS
LEFNESTKTEEGVYAKVKKPKKYRVLMHNDNYSTWEFVIDVLKRVFYKSEQEAIDITSNIHYNGIGVCGIYPHEIAVMKVSQVHSMAKANGYPLKCTLEEDE